VADKSSSDRSPPPSPSCSVVATVEPVVAAVLRAGSVLACPLVRVARHRRLAARDWGGTWQWTRHLEGMCFSLSAAWT